MNRSPVPRRFVLGRLRLGGKMLSSCLLDPESRPTALVVCSKTRDQDLRINKHRLIRKIQSNMTVVEKVSVVDFILTLKA